MKRIALILLVPVLILCAFISCQLEPTPSPEKPKPVTPGQSAIISRTLIDFVGSKPKIKKNKASIGGTLSVSGDLEFGAYVFEGVSFSAKKFSAEKEANTMEFNLTNGVFSASGTVKGPTDCDEDDPEIVTKVVSLNMKTEEKISSGSAVISEENKKVTINLNKTDPEISGKIEEKDKDDKTFTSNDDDIDNDFDDVFMPFLEIDFCDLEKAIVGDDDDDENSYLENFFSCNPTGELKIVIDGLSFDFGEKDADITAGISARGKVSVLTKTEEGIQSVSTDVDMDLGIAINVKTEIPGGAGTRENSIGFTINLKGKNDIPDIKEWKETFKELSKNESVQSLNIDEKITLLLEQLGLTLSPKSASVNGAAVDADSFYGILLAMIQPYTILE